MYNKYIRVVFLATTIFYNVDAKRNTHIKLSEFEEASPQPSVLTYSTFGFNDVGSYNGFLPSSSDQATFFNGNKQEQTKLYAPAFPTAMETSGFGGNYGSAADGEVIHINDGLQESISKYQPVSLNYFSSKNYISSDENVSKQDFENFDEYNNENNSPTYGVKLNSRNRNKPYNNYNNSVSINFKDESQFYNSNAYAANVPQNQHTIEVKEPFLETDNYPSYFKYNKYITTTTTSPEYDHIIKSAPVTAGAVKYPKVVEFTKQIRQEYPLNIEHNRYPSILDDNVNSAPHGIDQHSTTFNNNQPGVGYEKDGEIYSPPKYKNNFKDEKVTTTKQTPKYNYISNLEFSQNYFNNRNKLKDLKNASDGDKTKKPWIYNNKNEELKYSQKQFNNKYDNDNNNTNANFLSFHRTPHNNSNTEFEISPASTNLNLYNYKHPETDYENIRPIQHIKPIQLESEVSLSYPEKYKSINAYQKNIQNYFTTVPTETSHWGNLFKDTELTSYKNPTIHKPNYQEDDSEVIQIPKRQTYKYGKHFDGSAYDWSQFINYKPYTNPYKSIDWPKDIRNKYKTEEDLLDLRNPDTTRPSYPPRYRPYYDNEATEDFDYKKLVDKWRKKYLKSKQKDAFRDYETYASETKPIPVPIPRPYPIEVPRPVLVPVPQPYPVRVPVPKPVAVPVIRELSVPIEMLVPYPVIKKVPYPMEKPVPVPVEKQVHVPVLKHYPVKVPQVRPVFHHTQSHDERDSDYDDDDDYHPRPEDSRRIPSLKRPKAPRNQPRRPTRMTYQDRDKRRRPLRRPTKDNYRDSLRDKRPRRPQEHRKPPSRHQDNDYEEYEPREYSYCKRTGNC